MTLEIFLKNNDLPDVKKLGKLNGVTYYIQKNIPNNQDLGVPLMIKSVETTYSICTADESLKAIAIFFREE